MSTGTSTARPTRMAPSMGSRADGRPRQRRRGLRDARIRAKLALILVVPVIAIVALAMIRLVDSGQRAVSASLVSSLTNLSTTVAEVTQQLENERIDGAQVAAQPAAKTASDAYAKQIQSSDAAIQAYRDRRSSLHGLPSAVQARLDQIDAQLSTLSGLRKDVQAKNGVRASSVVLRYGAIINDLVAYHGSLSQVSSDQSLSDGLRAMAAFAQAKDYASQEQAIGYATLISLDVIPLEQYNAIEATLTGQQSSLAAFELSATTDQKTLIDTSITGDAISLSDAAVSDLTHSLSQPSTSEQAVNFVNALGAKVSLMRWAEQGLDTGLIAKADSLRSSVIREVVIESILVLITLALAIVIAFLLARQMARALSRLREGALTVAERDLPEAVARLRDVRDIGENSPDEIARQVRDPIRIDSRDEIGQVAQAFNVVHKEAVRVAAEQAALRTSVSAMFLNLARRSQALVDRMIGELDSIERGEEDPKRLAQLFQLDHLATRMRRNDENLLVLAGADSGAPRREDALLADVVRASQSEVELYNRIEFGTIDQDVSIAARAVNDVVRLIAELFDNATRFSPPNTSVVADARRIGDYVLVQVEDRGLGMSSDQMAALNARLAEPPSVDVAAFRMMGLAVVGRLAERYGIRVEMRPNPDGGTITHVTLPSGILILPRLRGREPVVTRPRSPLPVERGPVGSTTNSSGWPMPQLPGLAGAGSPASPGGVGTATLSGWAELSETRPDWNPVNQPAPPIAQPMSAPPAVASPTVTTPMIASPTIATPSVPPTTNGAGMNGAGMNGAGMNGAGANGAGADPQSVSVRPPADETAELPIFRAVEAGWFRNHGHSATGSWSAVPAGANGTGGTNGAGAGLGGAAGGYGAQPRPTSPAASVPAGYAPPEVPPPLPTRTPQSSSASSMPGRQDQPQPQDQDESWRTAADEGWQAAARAAEPSISETTRSGLPKRKPAAQLVPGGVDSRVSQSKTRRTPDEVRGLLSAYHRGVQRGRSGAGADGGAANNAHRSSNEERH